MARTYKRKRGTIEEEDSQSEPDSCDDDDDTSESDTIERVASLLQVGHSAVIRADDPIFFFLPSQSFT